MELKFQRDLDFQLKAINSVVKVFESQKHMHEERTLISENGIVSNQLSISSDKILENTRNVQKENEIDVVGSLDGMNFSIEMETGTGKTYVYLRTIFELYKKYGFKKFIIVVPSVAIREGVLKTLNITKKHFREIYENTPYNYYEYDSKKINLIRQFARGNTIEIMVITIDSFKMDDTIMNQERDLLHGQKPIDLVSKTNPILILDEPQNMDTVKAKDAISGMDPLFVLRYSATHRHYYNLVYRLTPVYAYKHQLVKKIEVSSVTENDYNRMFLRCVSITANSNKIKAKLMLNKKTKTGFKRKLIVIKHGDDLTTKTTNTDYSGFVVTEINAKYNFVRFANGTQINLGEEQGGNQEKIMESQIEQTVEEHFRKYQALKMDEIKPLSLFFIDKVDNYLLENGFIRKAFEKSFDIHKMKYSDFKHVRAKDVHSGYFSKKRNDRSIKKDKEAFDLIMKHKERLLSPDEPVQFIFSHSALREGWDNPNVFNICTLNQTVSDMKKRQEIGRGMRLPVDKNGNRITETEYVLTVIANESYEDYVSKLQQEYIDEYGDAFLGIKPANARERKTLKLEKGYRLNPEFKEMWERIAQKTIYAVHIDTDKLVNDCVNEINKMTTNTIKIKIDKVALSLNEEEGVVTKFVGEGSKELETNFTAPNILDDIVKETNLTRATVVKILCKIKNLNLIFTNPQEFISSCTIIIREKLADLLVNGIKYLKVDDWYKMKLFKDIETYKNLIVPVSKTIYDGVIWEADTEKRFAENLDRMENVRLFIKLPRWFAIETPIGTYNPDWAVVIDNTNQFGESAEKLYFVAETKGTMNIDSLRLDEKRKIHCAKKHFEAFSAEYKVVTNVKELIN